MRLLLLFCRLELSLKPDNYLKKKNRNVVKGKHVKNECGYSSGIDRNIMLQNMLDATDHKLVFKIEGGKLEHV